MITIGFLFLFGLFLLVLGGEILVKSASKIARYFGITPLVIGLTIVAFGTSSPELAVSLEAGLKQESGLVLGNVLGGNICNTLLILGVCALISPIFLSANLIKAETPFVAFITGVIYLMALDNNISRPEGLFLILLLALYTCFLIKRSSRENSEVKEQFAQEFGSTGDRDQLGFQIFTLICGLAGLTLGSHLTVSAAVEVASSLGVSDFLIGLTIVAVGTSLPELFTSVSAIIAGERDIAIGNVLGSNIFNLLMVLGTTAGLAPVEVNADILAFDLPVATLVGLVCIPIFFDLKIDRREGAFLLCSYMCYMIYSVTKAFSTETAQTVGIVSLIIIAPGVCLLLAKLLQHIVKARRSLIS
jgi:cation:H+ antiporter